MAKKKKPARGGSKPASAEPRSPGPAAERRRAEAEVRALIARIAPTQVRFIGALRRWMGKRLPTAHEMVYEYRDAVVISYSPSGRGYEGVLALRSEAGGVRLYFNFGKELPALAGVLQGSGNQMRWISLKSVSSLAQPEVAQLIEEAIASNRVPFALTGRGPLVIRPTSARRSRRG